MTDATAKDLEQDASLKQAIKQINALRAAVDDLKTTVADMQEHYNAAAAAVNGVDERLKKVEQSTESLSPIAHALDKIRNLAT
jgi:DNA-binding FrmR family transcriptional regulator